jgi:hypothetical protein
MEILSEETQEEPMYFEFKKRDFLMSTRPGNAGLRYDPFPEAQLDDVVRKEIIGRKLVWHAKIKDGFDIRPGVIVERDGHKFAITMAEQSIDTGICEVTGEEHQGECQPVKTLQRLIAVYAVKNPKGL